MIKKIVQDKADTLKYVVSESRLWSHYYTQSVLTQD